jgi:hypothetical protein
MTTVIIVILLVLALGGGGLGYRRWGVAGGVGPLGAVLLIILLLWAMGYMHG